MSKHKRIRKHGIYSGILLISLFTLSSFYLGELPFLVKLSISPLIIGIALGMIYANTLRYHVPNTWIPGIQFCAKTLLRWGIILYGFRVTLHSVSQVGTSGIVVNAIVIITVMILGWYIGKWLKLDKDITVLVSSGSAICGAAAVLAVESATKAKPYKTAISVAMVVLFGTIFMFLYPILYRTGYLSSMSDREIEIFTGATIHEVAHVVGAGNAMGSEQIANMSVVVKMIRVIFLAPFLVLLTLLIEYFKRKKKTGGEEKKSEKSKITIPWFAFSFMLVIIINSYLPHDTSWVKSSIKGIEFIDTFMLTMSMIAIGTEANFNKFKQTGIKPFLLAAILAVYLLFGGFYITKWISALFG